MRGNKMKTKAKETKRQRAERIANSNNGNTMRTRVVKDKKKYSRKRKHKNDTNEAHEMVMNLYKMVWGK